MADGATGNLPVPWPDRGPLISLGYRAHDLMNMGRYSEALEAVDAYEVLAQAAGDESTLLSLMQTRMYVLQQMGSHVPALAVGEELIRCRRAAGKPVLEAKSLADVAWSLVVTGQTVDAMRYLARAGILLDQVPPPHNLRYLSAMGSYCSTAYVAELYEIASDGFERIRHASASPGLLSVTDPYTTTHHEILVHWGLRLAQIGHADRAAPRLRRAVTIIEPWLDAYPHDDALRHRSAALHALALAKLGASDEVAHLAGAPMQALRAFGDEDTARIAHLACGIALAQRGDLAGAERELSAAWELVRPDTVITDRLFVAYERARLAVCTGAGSTARAVLDALHEQGRQLWQVRLQRLAMLRQAQEHEKREAEHARTETALLRDPLTGLGNRRQFERIMAAIDASAWSSPTSLLVIDVDDFKTVNDTYTHTGGDHVLRAIAEVLAANCRGDRDIAVRYAGDEFAVFLAADLTTATAVANRICNAVRTADLGHIAPGLRVSISTGVAALRPGMAAQDLFHFADTQLYRAKRAGRDRVASAATPLRTVA